MSRPPKFYFNACEICGAVFEARKADVKTCSPECRRKMKSRQMLEKKRLIVPPFHLASRKCVVCERDYEPVVGNQRTCSAGCSRALRQEQRKARELAAQEPVPTAVLPLHIAEDVCRKLGMTYGAASAEAFNCGLTLSQFLVVRARAEGIQIKKEECL